MNNKNHNRFEEAFKRLQQEVQTKINRKSAIKKIVAINEEGITPKPPAVQVLKSSRRNRRMDSTKKTVDEEKEMFRPSNPRVFSQMIKQSQAGSLSARPKHVNPVVDWDSHQILSIAELDINQILQKPPISIEWTKSIGKMPLELFDIEINRTESERGLIEFGFPSNGFYKYMSSNEIEWHPCSIDSYDQTRLLFTIRTDFPKKMIKECSRFAIRFHDENVQKFVERQHIAEQIRIDIEREARTLLFLDQFDIEQDSLLFFSAEQRKQYPKDVINTALRIQKYFFLLKIISNQENYELIRELSDIGFDTNIFAPRIIKYPLEIKYNSKNAMNSFMNFQSTLSKPKYLKTRLIINSILINTRESINAIRATFFHNETKCISDWANDYDLYEGRLTRVFEQMVRQLSDRLSIHICKNSEAISTFFPILLSSHPFKRIFGEFEEPYLRILSLTQLMLSEFVINVLSDNSEFFIELMWNEWKNISFLYSHMDNFKIINSKINQDSISSKTPLFSIDSDLSIDFCRDFLFKFANSIFCCLENMQSPFYLMLDNVNTSQIPHFSMFTIYPENKLYYGHDAFLDKLYQFDKNFKRIVEYHLSKVFNDSTTIQLELTNTKYFFDTFSLPNDTNILERIQEINKYYQFFIRLFPDYIDYGLFRVSFKSFRNQIENIVANHKINALRSIHEKMNAMIDDLDSDYKQILNSLKGEISSQEHWNSIIERIKMMNNTKNEFCTRYNVIKSFELVLFESYYGLNQEIMQQLFNIQMWPILLDIEIGRALCRLEFSSCEYIAQFPLIHDQNDKELRELEVSLLKEQDFNKRIQIVDYINHIKQKYQKNLMIENEMKLFFASDYLNPRIELWYIVSKYQIFFEEWLSMPISNIPYQFAQDQIINWNSRLVKIAHSFKNDHQSLKILLSTKNDLEKTLPLMKISAQISSPGLSIHSRKEIEKIIGSSNYCDLSINNLAEQYSFRNVVPEISIVVSHSKSVDKIDEELSNVNNTLLLMSFESNGEFVQNLFDLTQKLQTQKIILQNIINMKELSLNNASSSKLIYGKYLQIQSILEIFTKIQDLIISLKPLLDSKTPVDSLLVLSNQFHQIQLKYCDIVNIACDLRNIQSFVLNEMNIRNIKLVLSDIEIIKLKLLKLMLLYRNDSPRLQFVPDGRIIDIFSMDKTQILSVLLICFPSIKNWIVDGFSLRGFITQYNEKINFLESISIDQPVIKILPQVESSIETILRHIFFSFIDNISYSSIPYQLSFLFIIWNKEIEFSRFGFPKDQFDSLKRFSMILDDNQDVSLVIDKPKVFIKYQDCLTEYSFQVVYFNPLFISSSFLSLILKSSQIFHSAFIVAHSQFYGMGGQLAMMIPFFFGQSVYRIHSSHLFLHNIIKDIILRLNQSRIIVMIDEVQDLIMKNSFEVSILNDHHVICTSSSNTISSIFSERDPVVLTQSVILDHFHEVLLAKGDRNVEKTEISFLLREFQPILVSYNLENEIQFTSLTSCFSPHKKINRSLSAGSKLNIDTILLPTNDFQNAVFHIKDSIKNNRMMVLSGPEFSGKTTALNCASHALGIPLFEFCMYGSDCIKNLYSALIPYENHKVIISLLIPYNSIFMTFVSSIMNNSHIIDENNSVLYCGSHTKFVFQFIDSIPTLSSIPIPVYEINYPLVSTKDLFDYYIVKTGIVFPSEVDYITRSVIFSLVRSSLQLSKFFNILQAYIVAFSANDNDSWLLMVSYCIFWSASFAFSSIDDWINYSTLVKAAFNRIISFKEPFFHMVYYGKREKFSLYSLFNSKGFLQNDTGIFTHYSDNHCGNIAYTTIPIAQFFQPIQQLPMLIGSGHSCVLLGNKGTGKSTIISFLIGYFFVEPDYTVLSFDGKNLTTKQLIETIFTISTLNSDGIVVPRNSPKCIIVIDPSFDNESDIYGFILSILKTKNILIDKQMRSFHNFQFILSMNEYSYQICSACYTIAIPPITHEDVELFSNEIITRSLLKRQIISSQLSETLISLKQAIPGLFKYSKEKGDGYHSVSNAIRRIQFVEVDYMRYFNEFIYQTISHNNKEKHSSKFELYPCQRGKNDYLFMFKQIKEISTFESAILQYSKLFPLKRHIDNNALLLISFIIEIVQSMKSNAIIINDDNLDYEHFISFTCSILNSKYVFLDNVAQISQYVSESLLVNQSIVIVIRGYDQNIIDLVQNGLKTPSLPLFSSFFKDRFVIEKMESLLSQMCSFPFAKISNPKGIDEISLSVLSAFNRAKKANYGVVTSIPTKDKAIIQTSSPYPKPSEMNFLNSILFNKIHFIMLVPKLEEKDIDRFKIWNISKYIPESNYHVLQRLLSLILSGVERSFIDPFTQLNQVIRKYNFLSKKINSFIERRHMFANQVSVVLKSIENSIHDSLEAVRSISNQLEIDYSFLENQKNNLCNQQQIFNELSGQFAKLQEELNQIINKSKEYDEYQKKDSANTLEIVNTATRIVSKTFTQDEQYRLYIQQKPSAAVQHVFNTYCILHEFMPRGDGDYWPEARVLLRSGRFHKSITTFDPNRIRKEVLFSFDVSMKSPLINEDNFPINSPTRALAIWLKAIHRHTMSTSFHSSVKQQMIEIGKMKSQKENDLETIKDKLSVAKSELAITEKNYQELFSKIREQELKTARLTRFIDIAKEITQVFPVLKEELRIFTDGEKKYGENITGFSLKSTAETAILPLFPASSHPWMRNRIEELFQDSLVDSTYYVSIQNIVGSENPLVLALLAGEKSIACYDPHKTSLYVFGDTQKPSIPPLFGFSILVTSTLSSSFETDLVDASENGKLLVILHSDLIIHNLFFSSIHTASSNSAKFNNITVKIDASFAVVFYLDTPPKHLPSHTTFIHLHKYPRSRIQSIVLNDQIPLQIYEKKIHSETILHSQKETTFMSLQQLYTKLTLVYSADTNVIDDLRVQSQLLLSAMNNYNDMVFQDQHSIDGFQWVSTLSDRIMVIIDSLQELYHYSPLYQFPLERVLIILSKCTNQSDIVNDLLSVLSAAISAQHRWRVKEFGGITPKSPSLSNLSIFHYSDLSNASEFMIKNGLKNHFSVQSVTNFEIHQAQIQEMFSSSIHVAIVFFDENMAYSKQLLKFILQKQPCQSNSEISLSIFIDSSFELPLKLITQSEMYSLDI